MTVGSRPGATTRLTLVLGIGIGVTGAALTLLFLLLLLIHQKRKELRQPSALGLTWTGKERLISPRYQIHNWRKGMLYTQSILTDG